MLIDYYKNKPNLSKNKIIYILFFNYYIMKTFVMFAESYSENGEIFTTVRFEDLIQDPSYYVDHPDFVKLVKAETKPWQYTSSSVIESTRECYGL